MNMAGDADSTGAVCGQLVGAFYGADAVNPAWVDDLRKWDQVGVDDLREWDQVASENVVKWVR